LTSGYVLWEMRPAGGELIQSTVGNPSTATHPSGSGSGDPPPLFQQLSAPRVLSTEQNRSVETA
jgi:hypothetical protein